MEKLEFYEDYITYLEWRLSEGKITKGKYSLLKISKSEYDKFIKKLETDKTFNEKIVKIIRAEQRDKKIDKIILDEIPDEIINEVSCDDSEKIKDFFDDFDL